MNAFMLATIKVKEITKFQEYLAEVQKLSAKFGAVLLIRGKVLRVITGGDSEHELTIIVKFPDSESIDALFGSKEYQSLIPLREEGAHITMTAYQVMG